MNKYKYLLKNIGLLTISNFGTKIFSFILIPIYTNVLSTADYGIYDVYSTTISLLIPLLTFNIIDAVMRYALDQTKKKEHVFSIGIKRILFSALLVGILTYINSLSYVIDNLAIYPWYFVSLFACSILYDLLIQFSRGIEHISDIAIAGALNTIILVGLNVWFLLFLKLGLDGYFVSNIIAYVVPCIYLGIKLKIWRYIKRDYDTALEKEMYAYSKPLIFNTLAWWINNVSDRYIVTWLCGVAANGVYAVAYKIPSILNIFQSIFSQAWTISAVKEFDENSGHFYSKIYAAYNCGMVVICSVLIMADKLMAKLLFANEFYTAWKYAPFLMISVVFGALSGLLGGIFTAAKQTKLISQTTMMGACVNTVLNIVLVFFCGPVGAAIATLVSYCLVWAARFRTANKIIKLYLKIKRDVLTYCLLIIQAVTINILDGSMLYGMEMIVLAIVLLLYIKDIEDLMKQILNKHS